MIDDDENENFVIEDVPMSEKKEEKNSQDEKISFYEMLKMGPIDKYLKFGIFPWKMIIHILLVIFTICQSVLIISSMTNYTRAQERGLYNIFIDDSDKTDIDYNRMVYLYSIDDVKNHVKNSIKVFDFIIKIFYRIIMTLKV
jgi:hypothetical protein